MLRKRFGNDVAFDLEDFDDLEDFVDLKDLVDLEDLHLVEARIPYGIPWDFTKRPRVIRIYAHGVVVI
jgi:hypothetical protein